jgi:HAMP domain-containing protein
VHLLLRINLILGAVLALAAVVLSFAGASLLRDNARREAVREAGLMMDSALASRAYTSGEIVPLLATQMQSEFLPQSVPSYAATQNFLRLRAQRPEYTYKEATLNPTNPRDRAADWEADIVQKFRNDSGTHEIVGERATPMGDSLYLARPIRAESACLLCHSIPAAAPRTVIARYGSNNGFGWQNNEIVGAQIVSVPFAHATANADNIFRSLIISLSVTFAAVLLLINLVIHYLLLRPLRRMSTIADAVSLGDVSAAEFPETGSGEVSALARSFNRLRTSLDKALKLLGS